MLTFPFHLIPSCHEQDNSALIFSVYAINYTGLFEDDLASSGFWITAGRVGVKEKFSGGAEFC